MLHDSTIPAGPELAAKHDPGGGPVLPWHPWPVSVEAMRHAFEPWYDTDRHGFICARCVREGIPTVPHHP